MTKNISIQQMQKVVENWVSNPDFKVKYFPIFEMLGQLMEELGEVARELAHLHGVKKKKPGEKTEGLSPELGDLLFGIICIANSQGIDLADSFKKSMAKKTGRDATRFVKKKKK